MKNTDYAIHVYKDINQELISAWEDLWNRSENATLFNSYNWFQVNQDTLNMKEYEIVSCFKGEKLVGLIPLSKTNKFSIEVLSIIGYEVVSTPFLFEDYNPKLTKLFFDYLRKRGSFYLPKVHVDAIKVLHNQYPDMLYTLISVNPYLSIKDHPELINSDIGKKSTRKLLRRYVRNLRFAEYDHNTDLVDYLHKMFELEQKSEKKQRNMDIFSSPANRAFYENIVKYCKDFIQIHFLYFDDKPIAYTFNLCFKNILFGYQTAYLSVSGKKDLSPGKLMLLHHSNIIKAGNFDRYEMSCGMSDYKMEFASDYHYLYDIYYSQNFLIMLWWRLINFTRRLKQILFPLKYTRDHEFIFRVYPSLP